MAIFSKTQFPKYQNPIRITRPYIQPNYLADTITSAIQGYGSIQNMNMQQQLFNAKLAQQQKQQAIQDANKAAYQQLMQQQIGTPAVNPAPYVGPMGAGPMMLGTPAEPGMNPMQSVMAAMQSNPGARMQDIMAMAGGINTLQNPTSGLNPYQMQNQANWQRRFDREAQWRGETAAAKQTAASKAGIKTAEEAASKMIRNVFGNELLPDFKYDPWGINPEPGTEATMKFLQNAEWFDLKGVDAYNAMMKDLQGAATQMLLKGEDYNTVRAQLHGFYMQGTKKKSSGWQQPEIPQILQAQIDETRAKNKAKRDRLTAPSQ